VYSADNISEGSVVKEDRENATDRRKSEEVVENGITSVSRIGGGREAERASKAVLIEARCRGEESSWEKHTTNEEKNRKHQSARTTQQGNATRKQKRNSHTYRSLASPIVVFCCYGWR
jgi:hypothetical protein